MFEQGYVTLRGRGVALRLHWSIPVVGLILTWFRFSAGAWFGFVALLGVHMLGHAGLASLCGGPHARLSRIDVHGLGGHCGTVGLTARRRMLIASGGVLAQVALALVVVLVLRPVADSPFETELLDMFVGPSLLVAGLNVLPIAPLDGASFWQLPRTVEGMADEPDEPESFDNPRPQRANPNPPRRDWFARVRSRSARARAAVDAKKLEDDEEVEAELSPEAENSIDRLFKRMKDSLGE